MAHGPLVFTNFEKNAIVRPNQCKTHSTSKYIRAIPIDELSLLYAKIYKSIQSCGLYPKCGYFLTKLYIHQKNFQIKITNITYGFISLSSTLTRPLPFHPMQKIQQERKTTFAIYKLFKPTVSFKITRKHRP